MLLSMIFVRENNGEVKWKWMGIEPKNFFTCQWRRRTKRIRQDRIRSRLERQSSRNDCFEFRNDATVWGKSLDFGGASTCKDTYPVHVIQFNFSLKPNMEPNCAATALLTQQPTKLNTNITSAEVLEKWTIRSDQTVTTEFRGRKNALPRDRPIRGSQRKTSGVSWYFHVTFLWQCHRRLSLSSLPASAAHQFANGQWSRWPPSCCPNYAAPLASTGGSSCSSWRRFGFALAWHSSAGHSYGCHAHPLQKIKTVSDVWFRKEAGRRFPRSKNQANIFCEKLRNYHQR